MVPRDSEAGLVTIVAWFTLILGLATAANVRRWRRVLRDAERRGEQIPIQGRRSLARRIAEWSLSLSVLLGACSSPTEAPGIKHLGPAPDATTLTTESVPATTSPTSTVAPTTTPPSTHEPSTTVTTTTDNRPDPGDEAIDRPAESPAPDADPPAWTPTTNLPTAHVVQPGEHLWGIAEAAVRGQLGPDATSTDVADYWVELIASNRSMLRSGDPNLIHPGEAILLPPMSALTPAAG